MIIPGLYNNCAKQKYQI